jgi:hypothetical protein
MATTLRAALIAGITDELSQFTSTERDGSSAYLSAVALAAAAMSQPDDDEGVPALSLQDVALLSLLQDVAAARSLLPCVLSPAAMQTALAARLPRAARVAGAVGATAVAAASAAAAAAAPALAPAPTASPSAAQQSGVASFLQCSVALLCSPGLDARLAEKHLPEALAAALLLRRCCGGGVGGARDGPPAAAAAALEALRGALPPRALASAFIVLASGRLAPGGGGPDAHAPWLRVAAGGELSRLSLREGGAAALIDAMLSLTDCGSAVAVDRAVERCAAILGSAPLELCTAREYFAALGPQLAALLRLGGGGARPLVDTAARVLGALLAAAGAAGGGGGGGGPDGGAGEGWRFAVRPLLAPLLAYAAAPAACACGGGAPPGTPLFGEEEVLASVEAIHKVLLQGGGGGGAALLLPALPALLDLHAAFSASPLRASSGVAAGEAAGAVLGALPPCEAGAALCAALGVPIPTALSTAGAPPAAARHPCLRFRRGEGAAFELVVVGGAGGGGGGTRAGEKEKKAPLPRLRLPRGGETGGGGGCVDDDDDDDGGGGAARADAAVSVLSTRMREREGAAVGGAVFSALLGFISARGGGSGGGERVRALQLFLALAERVGPRLLRGELECARAVRAALAVAVAAAGLVAPRAEDVGAGGPGTRAWEIACDGGGGEAAGAAARAGEGGDDPPLADAAAVDENEELASTCLGLLSMLLTTDAAAGEDEGGGEGGGDADAEEAAERHALLKSTLPQLAALEQGARSAEVREAAGALRVLALFLPAPSPPQKRRAADAPRGGAPPPAACAARSGGGAGGDAAMAAAAALVLDPEPAVAAHGLRALARGVESAAAAARAVASRAGPPPPPPPPALAPPALASLALSQLCAGDSYVYLAAVSLARALAAEHPRTALPLLLRAYAGEGTPPPPAARARLGEALAAAARAAGASGALPALAPALLGCFLRVGAGGWRAQGALAARLLGDGAAEAPLAHSGAPAGNAPEDVGNALADAAALRASALSCVGEVAAHLGASLPRHAGDVVGGLCGVLQWERSHCGGGGGDGEEAASALAREAAALVRRAAALALRRLLQGPRALEALAGEGLMGGLYEALNAAAAGDPDARARAHARDALAAVDDAVARIAGGGAPPFAAARSSGGATLKLF